MYREILIPTDGSPAAENAARHAVALAQANSTATVHALSIINSQVYEQAESNKGLPLSDKRKAAEQRAQAAVDSVAELGSEIGQAVTTTVERGIPYKTILEYAAESGCDLIVMGTRGWTELSRVLIGSVTEKVVRSTRLPVLTVHPEVSGTSGTPRYDRILSPTDGSEGSAIALTQAIDIAQTCDSTLYALSVIDSHIFAADEGLETGEMIETLEQNAERHVSDSVAKAEESGVTIRSDVEIGIPFSEICSYATQNDIDLIVMGTHGRTGLERFLIGSVTERVIRHSKIPVLVIRTPPEDD